MHDNAFLPPAFTLLWFQTGECTADPKQPTTDNHITKSLSVRDHLCSSGSKPFSSHSGVLLASCTALLFIVGTQYLISALWVAVSAIDASFSSRNQGLLHRLI